MTEEEILLTGKSLLLKINFITGWALYDDELDQSILEQQFVLKLQESYPFVNSEEIEFAFRNNTSVKDWGKNINLAMIDEVMIPYLETRAEASKMEEQLNSKVGIEPPKEPVSEAEILEIAEGMAKSGHWKLMPVRAYSILVKRKEIQLSQEEKEAIKRAVIVTINEMYREDKNLFTHTSREVMEISFCKKVAVRNYYSIK